MRRRILTTALAATLAAAGLAGCQSNVGVAARVDGYRITESTVNDYLAAAGVDKTLASQAKAQGQQVSPRSEVLLWLIREQVFEKTLKEQHIPATDAQLAALHDEAGSGLLNQQLKGDQVDRTVEQQLVRLGIKRSFREKILRAQELELLLIKKRKMAQESQLVATVKPVSTAVSVSPRYGTWNPKTLVLASAVLPSFVTPQPTLGAGS